ncbi:isoleucine--tRNA ligase [Agrococcus jejuensis]|uniref:Isoleucine--tRNA ligase n=1 Tax=Agrococcus jejuensis TaxID=399736 RepID=A0A1G8GV14_9MICO|nr:isoleucine--tRNA ligase [Agrococcus jejuensis]SDH98173.1 Isoleucyl-tRNA synthetase [Agrococcus jejuensis]
MDEQRYPRHGGTVVPNPSFPAVEEGILAFWKGDDTFQASIDQRDGCEEWVFYDGPPFANGLPHYGHLLTGYAKDVFPRYQTMRGKQVQRRFGWDTHGLPAELEAMKQLGITEKAEIEAMGVDVFNAKARESVLEYTREWQDYVTRQARWVDFEHDYKTLDVGYMESVIWAFSELYAKGLAYEGYRVLPYCWRDETPLSAHELRMDDDVYQERQDPSVTVTFPLEGDAADAAGLAGVRMLAWTTTPWTLPTNMALAVGPGIAYVVVAAGPAGAADGGVAGETRYLLAADTLGAHAKVLGYDEGAPEVLRTVTGADLGGLAYRRLFDDFADADEWGTGTAWRVLVDDYVATGEGTGIVHQAPAYGEDDQRVTAAAGIPTILSVDDGGRFLQLFATGELAEIAGVQVFEANRTIIRALQAKGRLLREASYLHPYPHCWRCRNPLIYKAVSSWFVRVTDIKDDLIAANERINWVPENVKHGQFGKWLEGARDWSISRNRYWGSPIPVWKSDDPNFPRIDVYGSLDELERDFGVRPADLHRPYIDELTRPNPDDPTGRSTMRRIPDVLDVWFDSGSMPFAQVHYPFEQQEWFDTHSPADYIVEYIGQTRGWFYVLHVLSVALFGREAFRNVISHGIILGDDGFKASKSRRNYPDVNESFDAYGSDAVRWNLLQGSILRGGNFIVSEEGIREALRQFHLPLWSTWYFLTTYANRAKDGQPYVATPRADSTDVLDRYVLAKLRETVEAVTSAMDALDATGATLALREFTDTLTNWYVRRSRDRFWAGVTDDPRSTEAFDTLALVLETLTTIAAPLAPLVAEEVWRGLTGGRSVHLTDWPDASALPADPALVAQMDEARAVVNALHGMRKQRRLRVRLPLAEATITSRVDLSAFADLVRDEVNLKAVHVVHVADDEELPGLSKTAQIVSKVAAPRLKGDFKRVFAAIRAGEWTVDGERLLVDGVVLEPGEFALLDEPTESAYEGGETTLLGHTHLDLDTATTSALEAEGLARDAVRAIQDARKQADLDVSDRIVLVLGSDAHGVAALETHRDLVAGETLATTLTIERVDDTAGEAADAADVRVGDGSPLTIRLERA